MVTTGSRAPCDASARAADAERERRGRRGEAGGPQLAGPVERRRRRRRARPGAAAARPPPPRRAPAPRGAAARRGALPGSRRPARDRRRRARRPSPGRPPRPAASRRCPPQQLARAVCARDDDPVVAGDVDRPVAERLDLDQGAARRPRARATRDATRAPLPGRAGRVTTILTRGSPGEGDELGGEHGWVAPGAPLEPGPVLGGDERGQVAPSW